MLMKLMDNNPYDFIINANERDFYVFRNFRHRTFNYDDTVYFCKSLKNICCNHGGIKAIFEESLLVFAISNTVADQQLARKQTQNQLTL